MEQIISPLIEVLNHGNTVSRNRLLSFAIGNAEAEIYNCLVSKHIYYDSNGKLLDGWFYSTVMDLHLSSGYGEDAQRSAVRHLISQGLIECELKGIPARRYFRIIPDAERLSALLSEGEKIQTEIAARYRTDNGRKKKIIELESTAVTDTVRVADISVDCSDTVRADTEDFYTCPCSVMDRVSDTAVSGITSSPEHGTASSPVNGGTCSPEAPQKSKEINHKKKILSLSTYNRAQSENFCEVGGLKDKNTDFSEILLQLGLDKAECECIFGFVPRSEKELALFDENDRQTKNLSLTETLRTDKQTLLTALKFLCCYEYYSQTEDGEESAAVGFMDGVLGMIAELIMGESFNQRGEVITYKEVISAVNEIVHTDGLYEFVIDFYYEWQRIVGGKDYASVRNPYAYMRACLWNRLKVWRAECVVMKC